MKPSKCKVCGTEYTKTRPMQKACSVECAIKHAGKLAEKKKAKEAAKERKQTREKLKAMETYPQLVKKAQTAFNAFIRARDAGKPCICCGTPLGSDANSADAGHYRSVGSAPHMRFVEDNCHLQSKRCNRYLAGNHVEYRKGLIARIGLHAVEMIEADQTVRKYTREALVEIARHYREKAKELRNGRQNEMQS